MQKLDTAEMPNLETFSNSTAKITNTISDILFWKYAT